MTSGTTQFGVCAWVCHKKPSHFHLDYRKACEKERGIKLQSNMWFWDIENSFFFFFFFLLLIFSYLLEKTFSAEKKILGEQEKENSHFQGLWYCFWLLESVLSSCTGIPGCTLYRNCEINSFQWQNHKSQLFIVANFIKKM